MKRKFIALLLSMVSVTSLIAACNKEEPPVVQDPCTTHVDTDKNAVCDACGKDIIYIKDQIVTNPETPVDMVVKPIPVGAVKSDYIKDVEKEENVIPTNKAVFDIWSQEESKNVEIENLQVTRQGNFATVSYAKVVYDNTIPEAPVESSRTNHVILYDLVNNKEVYRFDGKMYTKVMNDGWEEYIQPYYDIAEIAVYDVGVYIVGETRYVLEKDEYGEDYYIGETTYKIYTHAHEKLYGDTIFPEDTDIKLTDAYAILYINDTVYAIDNETYEVLHTAHKDVFVNRPQFDVVQGNYGYVYSQGGLYVYDLTKWIDCVYANTNLKGSMYVLADGNVLVQSIEGLSDNAVSYDVIEDNQKYDLVQTIVNPVEGTETEVEFGYLIQKGYSTASKDGEFLVKEDSNAFKVTPIEGRMYADKELIVVTDCQLNILYGEDYETFEMKKVGEDLYVKNIVFGDGSQREAVVNGKGELVSYLPSSYVTCEGFILVENARIYNWEMELVLDCEKAEYNNGRILDNKAFILSKVVEEDNTETPDPDDKKNVTHYYYYNPVVNATPVQLDRGTRTLWGIQDKYFVMLETYEEMVEEEPTVVNKYIVYNANNELVGEFNANVTGFVQIGDSGMYWLVNDGVYYIIK